MKITEEIRVILVGLLVVFCITMNFPQTALAADAGAVQTQTAELKLTLKKPETTKSFGRPV